MELMKLLENTVEHGTWRLLTDLDGLQDRHSLEHLAIRVRRPLAPVAVALESGRLEQEAGTTQCFSNVFRFVPLRTAVV